MMYLLYHHKLNRHMSSYQVFRIIVQFIGSLMCGVLCVCVCVCVLCSVLCALCVWLCVYVSLATSDWSTKGICIADRKTYPTLVSYNYIKLFIDVFINLFIATDSIIS